MASCEPRRPVHDANIQLRISATLLNRTESAARSAGVSVSEYVRTVIRQEVGAA